MAPISVRFLPLATWVLITALGIAAARSGIAQSTSSTSPLPAPSSLTSDAPIRGHQGTLADGLARLAEGNFQAASEILAGVVVDKQANLQKLTGKQEQVAQLQREAQQLQQAMVGAGSALRQLGRSAEAFEFFDSAVLLARNPAHGFATSQQHLQAIRLAAGECAANAGRHEQAMEHCQAILRDLEGAPGDPMKRIEATGGDSLALLTAARQTLIRSALALKDPKAAWEHFEKFSQLDNVDKRALLELSLAIGLAALSGNEPAIAQIAFRWYLKHAVDSSTARPDHQETAILGIAWAAAQGAEPYEVAASRLLDFVDQFPDSQQASKALFVAGGCFEKCGDSSRAIGTYEKILAVYPQSSQALQATIQLLRLQPAGLWSKEKGAVITQAIDALDVIPVTLIEAAALAAARNQDESLWQKLLNSIQTHNDCGTQVGLTLSRLCEHGFASHAERLATQVLGSASIRSRLGSIKSSEHSPFEQTCRWAALAGHWDMLAIAGREVVREGTFNNSGDLGLRLLAEGAMQANDLETAKSLLDLLVGKRGNQDFDTLLRKAEVAISIESKEVAAKAIEAAEKRAGSTMETALTSVLKAQWYIRDARMIDARSALEQVLRAAEVGDEVKARAQWLMGETYYLQRQFADAVSHYRLVEPLDTTGIWTAAALVQAGRCFEELGREREAAVCYTHLISRFGTSPHLPIAQQRLAALGSTETRDVSPNKSGQNTKLR